MANPFELKESSTFDEILPEPINVTLVEFEEYEATSKGKKVIRRKPVQRTATINTYVPMKIFHQMMASQEKIKGIQEARKNGVSLGGDEQELMLSWMVEQVLAVWRLTEPEMTSDELSEGLDFQKVLGLFSTFFGDLLKNQGVALE